MQPIAFCNRCRGMKVGLNRRYLLHSVLCREWVTRSSKLLILVIVLSTFIFKYPAAPGALLGGFVQPEQPAVVEASFLPPVPQPEPVSSISAMLARYGVDASLRDRVSRAIVTSSAKYNLDPRLVASIVIVESRANPFAISGSDSIGIMQIHLPTWGPLAEQQGVNLFKIEDNADLGVRILSGYIATYGVWGGVAHYNGLTDGPEAQRGADEYVQKVQKIYGYIPPAGTGTSQAALK